MKYDFRKPNHGSIINFSKIKSAFLPKREPDFTHYSYRRRYIFNPEEEFDEIDHNDAGFPETGRIIILNSSGEEFETREYTFERMQNITYQRGGYLSDTPAYVYIDTDSAEKSEYWYTAHGVYRRSTHWGKVGQSAWSLSSGETKSYWPLAGYANYRDIIFKQPRTPRPICDVYGKVIYRNPSATDNSQLVYSALKAGINLRYADFSGMQLKGVHFRHIDLSCARFDGAHLYNCIFREVSLRGASFKQTYNNDVYFCDASRRSIPLEEYLNPL